MMHDGSQWHGGFGFGHWAVGLLFWLVVILLIAALLKYIFTRRK